jgi:hypothetical protein
MKKQLIVCLLMLIGATTASAQRVSDSDFERGFFDYVGLNVGVGTEGITAGIAAPITDYLELGFNFNYMPSFKVKEDVKIKFNLSNIPGSIRPYIPESDKINLTGDLARSMLDAKLSIYPFGGNSTFFITGGISFIGEKMAKINGSSELIAQYPELRNYTSAEIDKYDIQFDEQGRINGDIRVKKLRPYVGLGVGRLIPKHRVGFRVEAGCQFAGKMKVYQDDKELIINEENDTDDKFSKTVDKMRVYPVLKFTLTGRIF